MTQWKRRELVVSIFLGLENKLNFAGNDTNLFCHQEPWLFYVIFLKLWPFSRFGRGKS